MQQRVHRLEIRVLMAFTTSSFSLRKRLVVGGLIGVLRSAMRGAEQHEQRNASAIGIMGWLQ